MTSIYNLSSVSLSPIFTLIMSFPYYQQANPGWGTPQVLSTLSPYFSIHSHSSINLVPLQHQPFNLNPRVSNLIPLSFINRSSHKQGGAWISIVPMQQPLIREHPIHSYAPSQSFNFTQISL